jgi:hypothetical protein
MVTASDPEYLATKRLKLGQARLYGAVAELADWVATTYGVTVLNVVCDPRNAIRGPRLQIIVEHQAEAEKFHDGVNFDPQKQRAIRDRYLEILRRDAGAMTDVDGLFVVFSAFASIAREEAHSRVTDAEIAALQARIGDPTIWTISRCFSRVTFFFYNQEQLRLAEAAGKRAEYSRAYFELLAGRDEFGYLDEESFQVDFDTKENFDANYQGSWFNYYR